MEDERNISKTVSHSKREYRKKEEGQADVKIEGRNQEEATTARGMWEEEYFEMRVWRAARKNHWILEYNN